MIIFQSKLYCTEVLKVITTMKNKLANEHCTEHTPEFCWERINELHLDQCIFLWAHSL